MSVANLQASYALVPGVAKVWGSAAFVDAVDEVAVTIPGLTASSVVLALLSSPAGAATALDSAVATANTLTLALDAAPAGGLTARVSWMVLQL